jgi:hypothetical protein
MESVQANVDGLHLLIADDLDGKTIGSSDVATGASVPLRFVCLACISSGVPTLHRIRLPCRVALSESTAIDTRRSPKEPIMTTRFSHHAAAFALALATTLAIFSGVSSLSSPSHTGAMLVQAQSSASPA